MRKKAQVRGMALLSGLKFVEKKKGKEGLKRVFERLDRRTRDMLSNIVMKEWYPYETAIKFQEVLVEVIGKGKEEILKEEGEFIAKDNTKWFLRLFLKFSTPQKIIKKWPIVWSLYYNKGALKIVMLKKKSAVIRLIDFPELKHTTCILVIGWGFYSLKKTGAKNTAIKETKCREKGDKYSEWHIKWE